MSAPRVEAVDACPICGSSKLRFFDVFVDRISGVAGRYAYWQCRDCDTVFQSPRVIDADLGLLYPEQYIMHAVIDAAPDGTPGAGLRGVRDRIRARIRAVVQGGEDRLGGLLAASRFLRERAFFDFRPDELIPRSPVAGRALDVGCGSGLQMRALRRLGWQVEGLEWDPAAADAASRATGLPVHAGDVHALAGIGPYDLILLHHVFEHVHDPVAALRSLRGVLTAGGRIVLVHPNQRSLARRVYGRDWLAWEAPRHLILPPPGSVDRAARRAGLRVVVARTTARFALPLFFHSRHGHERGRIDLTDDETKRSDRVLAGVERALVALGIPVGEEAIVALERRGEA